MNQNADRLSEITVDALSVAVTVMTLGDVNALGTRTNERWMEEWEAVGVRSLSVLEPTQTLLWPE